MKKIFILTGEPSGDKLASKVISKLKKNDPKQSLKKSCAIGAMVASESGANPEFNEEEIRTFIESY